MRCRGYSNSNHFSEVLERVKQVESLLKGLGLDLQQRCLAIQGVLGSKRSGCEIQDYVKEIYNKTEQIQQEIEALLSDPDLGNIKLLPNQFFAFSRLAERLSEIEWYPLPAITRYNDTDHFLGYVCALLVRQVQYPLQIPLVSGFSSDYYGAIPPYRLIKVPAAEHLFLLGLPDLCHELGHILFSNYTGTFLGNFLSDLSAYIQSEKQRRIREGAPPNYQVLYDRLETDWKDRWMTEFASDMIATFMVGPAFGHTHLRLCCSLDPDVFRPGFGESSTHPSGESRIRAIIAMLKRIGLEEDSEVIQNQWLKYLSAIGSKKPIEYDHCYPDALIDSLTREVHNGCVKNGLTTYKDQQASNNDINLPALLNEAWTVLLANPQGYAEWESAQVKRLRDNANKAVQSQFL
jgi:hypothetical protein